MMSSILTVNNNKNKCQKFTPSDLVEKMLDLADYKSELMGKTVLENSFGSGNILKEIVVRYIKSALKDGYSLQDISSGLGRDIYGIELDKELFENCLSELNNITEKFSMPKVDWNLINGNALDTRLNCKFDYIIGNPPYISYREMDEDSRTILKQKFNSCSEGKFDYCYAFLEMSVNLLSTKGKLVQLIPNNIYKNVFGKNLRNILSEHIEFIYDYPNQKIFDKTLTSVSIFLYDKTVDTDMVTYVNKTQNTQKTLSRQHLGEKWTFENQNSTLNKKVRFGDYFNASIAIATLLNEAFIIDEEIISKENLEAEVIRKAVSPRALRYKKKMYIIFPYKYENDKLIRYTESEFINLFPNVAMHLKKYIDKLELRNSDSSAQWFEYGRSQALAHLNTEKLLLSTIITNDVELYKINAETIPYSGVYITLKSDKYCLSDALRILKDPDFLEYARNIGISVNGKSIRITCKDINDYEF